ncbi:MAG: hypothetical protein ACOC6D_07255 [Atribacterota bacterium]
MVNIKNGSAEMLIILINYQLYSYLWAHRWATFSQAWQCQEGRAKDDV